MPDRALRPSTVGRNAVEVMGLNASNARQGIKTRTARTASRRDDAVRLNASNARQGIKTHRLVAAGNHERRLNASNARQGIKTVFLVLTVWDLGTGASERLQCPTGH